MPWKGVFASPELAPFELGVSPGMEASSLTEFHKRSAKRSLVQRRCQVIGDFHELASFWLVSSNIIVVELIFLAGNGSGPTSTTTRTLLGLPFPCDGCDDALQLASVLPLRTPVLTQGSSAED